MEASLIARVIIDTSVYIGVLRDRSFAHAFRPRYERDLARTYVSSVVVQELLVGAVTPQQRRQAMELYGPFERVRRLVTPTHTVWKEAGALLSVMTRKTPSLRSRLRAGLVNDVLIALSARTIGARVITRDRNDFELIRTFRPFQLEIV